MEQKESGSEVLDEETVFNLIRDHKDFIAAILSEEDSVMGWIQASDQANISVLETFIHALEDLNEGSSEEFDFGNFARVVKFGSYDRLTTYLIEEEPALMHQLQTAGILTPMIDVAISWEQEQDLEPESVEVEEFDAEEEHGVEMLMKHRNFIVHAIENSALLKGWISTQSDQSLKKTIEDLRDAFIENEEDTEGKLKLGEFEDALLSGNSEALTEFIQANSDIVEKLLPDIIASVIEVAELWQKDKDFVVNALIEHYNFFKAAFSDPKFIDKVPEESRGVLRELYARMSQIYTTDEKIRRLEDSLTEIHLWRPYFSQQTNFLISIRDIVESLSQVAVTWESQQKIEVSLPEIAELAITSQPYLEQALHHLKNLRELFHESGHVDFEGFVKLFFFENRPKILPEDPNDSNYANVRLHNIQVRKLDEELGAVYNFLVEYSGKSDDEFTQKAKELIGPQIYQDLGETDADFRKRLQEYPTITEYFKEISALMMDISSVGTKNSEESSSSTQLISKEYLKKLESKRSEESKLLGEKVDKVKNQDYYKKSLIMVDEMDNRSDDNKKYMAFFKQDSHGQPYLNTTGLQSIFGRLAAGMSLDRNEYEKKLKLLKVLGYQGLPKELRDVNTYIRVNQDYSAFINEVDRQVSRLKLLKKLYGDDKFKDYFDAETQLKIESALNSLPENIDLNNVDHIIAIEKAYRGVNHLCKINNYPIISEVREMRKAIPAAQLENLNIYLVDQRGKEIISERFQVNNLEDLSDIHQVYNVLSSSDTMRFVNLAKFLMKFYPENSIGRDEVSIRKFYAEHVEITNQQSRELNTLQKCLKYQTFRSHFSEGVLLKIQESLENLPKSRDGLSIQIDVNNADHLRELKTVYEFVNSVCIIKEYPQILIVRELMRNLTSEQRETYKIELYDSQGREIIHENFQVNNLHDLACVQNSYKLLMEISPSKKSIQGERDLSPKTIQQEKHLPVPGYASPKTSKAQKEKPQNTDAGKSESLGDGDSDFIKKVSK